MVNIEDEQIQNTLNEILKWIRVVAAKQAKETLEVMLNNDEKKLIYHLSNGKNRIRDIIDILKREKYAEKKSTATISKLWKEWAAMGLGEYIPTKGGDRFRRSFDLDIFGIPIPKYKEPSTNDEELRETYEKEEESAN